MKKWSHAEGTEFKNSELCYGLEYKPGTGKIDIAKIMIRGDFPGNDKWGYLEDADEMAVGTRGKGYIETQKEGKVVLQEGDVVHIPALERFRWGGDMDMIVPCGPAFDPAKHKIEEAA